MKNEPDLTTEVATANPRDLKLLEKNAHFMSERTFKQLVSNIERDGCLTSAPLVYEAEGKMTVLSGNHRVKASMAAGLAEIPVILIKGTLTEARQVAIQLSHNAIVGVDDTNMLRDLFDSLDILEQRYSGLTDTDLGVLTDPELFKLSVGMPSYDEMLISFLPDDLTEFTANLEKLKLRMEKHPVIFARFRDYHDFFKAFLTVKEHEKIGNDGVALLVMSQLALEVIEARTAGEVIEDADVAH